MEIKLGTILYMLHNNKIVKKYVKQIVTTQRTTTNIVKDGDILVHQYDAGNSCDIYENIPETKYYFNTKSDDGIEFYFKEHQIGYNVFESKEALIKYLEKYDV